MASNFRIFIHRDNGNLHLKLKGDFDGSSAHELINTLKARYEKAGNIIVDTCGLAHIHPFGLDVFQKKCSGARMTRNLKFTGKHGNTISPRE
jgi:anti-anti-sigma regulatory factor